MYTYIYNIYIYIERERENNQISKQLNYLIRYLWKGIMARTTPYQYNMMIFRKLEKSNISDNMRFRRGVFRRHWLRTSNVRSANSSVEQRTRRTQRGQFAITCLKIASFLQPHQRIASQCLLRRHSMRVCPPRKNRVWRSRSSPLHASVAGPKSWQMRMAVSCYQ